MTASRSLLVIVIMLILVVLSGIAFSSGQGPVIPPGGGKRVPVGPPVEPPTVKIPDCPTDFSDDSCTMSGKAFGFYAQETWGAAALKCDAEKPKCEDDQDNEYETNRIKCEKVKGCKLHATVDYQECGLGSGNDKDCSPKATQVQSTSSTSFYVCNVKGSYDITGYECDRAAST